MNEQWYEQGYEQCQPIRESAMSVRDHPSIGTWLPSKKRDDDDDDITCLSFITFNSINSLKPPQEIGIIIIIIINNNHFCFLNQTMQNPLWELLNLHLTGARC